ncbi:IS3 family transposase [Methylocystis sp. IM3]|uniref:IS3 family transposase n=1 Tax=unclassified Methylocystis TaxID=2625913 RepID=UPI0030FB5A0B
MGAALSGWRRSLRHRTLLNTSKPTPGHKIYPYLLRGVTVERPDHVWAMDISYIPMRRDFVYLAAVVDVASRRVLAHRVSITMEAEFCIEAVKEALAKHGKPEIFNTDQGSQFTSLDFTRVLLDAKIAISMDGKGAWRDNVFVERLWRSVKYEEVYLRAYDTVSEARASIGRYLAFYNRALEHPSLYVIEGKRLCWPRPGPAGYLALRRALSTTDLAASVASAARANIQGPSDKGRRPSISPTSTASRRVLGETFNRRAASERLSQGSTSSSAALNTGMRWCERNEVTRSRVQRLPWPVLRPLRLRRPAIRSSLAISASSRTAAMMSAGVLLRCPRRRLGKRSSL